MSWAVGFDSKWGRDIGYGVPSICDKPDCDKEIDRGLAFVCGGDPYGGDHGCGLYFCEHHLAYQDREKEDGSHPPLCDRCITNCEPYEPKPDTKEWREWKRTDPSWALWREENKELASAL